MALNCYCRRRRSPHLIIRDGRDDDYSREAQADFHIEADDYFATTATIIGLIGERLESRFGNALFLETETIREIESELIFLQKNYRIIGKRRHDG